MIKKSLAPIAAALLGVALGAPPSAADVSSGIADERGGNRTVRVSVKSDESEAIHSSRSPDVSADGRYVIFASRAKFTDDTYPNRFADQIFLRDELTGETRLVSKTPGGVAGDEASLQASISDDGSVVVFVTYAANLVGENSHGLLVQYDVVTRELSLLSRDADGGMPNGQVNAPSISATGETVAFMTTSTDLVPEDQGNNFDVIVLDIATGDMQLVSRSLDGGAGNGDSLFPDISADGTRVAFHSDATDLVDDADTNGANDVFLADLRTGHIELVSVNAEGLIGDGSSRNAAISGNGKSVVFVSSAQNLADVGPIVASQTYVRSVARATTTIVSLDESGLPSSQDGYGQSLSANGRWVVFATAGRLTSLPADGSPSDIYLHNLRTESTTVVSRAGRTEPANDFSMFPMLTPDARHVVFVSRASNLVPDDFNHYDDVFLHRIRKW
jgi:Tol biopolymer transport system component